MKPRRILLFSNAAWNLAHFRQGLIASLVGAGHEVVAAAPADAAVARLSALGARPVPIPLDPRGVSPPHDLLLLTRIARLVREERPDLILTYTIKPNIYGTLAARIHAVPAIATVTGLGTSFLRGGALALTARTLTRVALRSAHTVVFQNPDDRDLYLANGLAAAHRTALVPGSGVDLTHFQHAPRDPPGKTILFVGRLLRDKGVEEFAQAARIVRATHPDATFQLLGPVGSANATAIAPDVLARWEAEGIVTHLGEAADVRPTIAAADVVVLPSYREGTPRALLEAAAMGKPLIATDVPGCREPVEHGGNGFLCAPRSGPDLAAVIKEFLALPPATRRAMGIRSRQIAETRFDERIVIDTMERIMEAAAAGQHRASVH